MNLSDNQALFDAADARARLAGSNRMEILLFSLGTAEVFGINVFKVREVMQAPVVTPAPNLPFGIEGVVSLRGNIISVIALTRFIGAATPTAAHEAMIVTEFSRRTQGFLVNSVDRILRVDWQDVRAAQPTLAGNNGLVTAITALPDGTLVSILDVEQILANVFGAASVPAMDRVEADAAPAVLFADDSAVARKEIVPVLDKLGIRHSQATNGVDAWARLQSLAAHAHDEGVPLSRRLGVILTDAEMPEMDGYVLTRRIKSDPRFDGIAVVMHSSLSSDASRAMGKNVGVDAYVSKFDPVALADTLRPLLAARAH
jgi:two-component system chemotaxis response regulator CheV